MMVIALPSHQQRQIARDSGSVDLIDPESKSTERMTHSFTVHSTTYRKMVVDVHLVAIVVLPRVQVVKTFARLEQVQNDLSRGVRSGEWRRLGAASNTGLKDGGWTDGGLKDQ
jgi:hypothetical protein